MNFNKKEKLYLGIIILSIIIIIASIIASIHFIFFTEPRIVNREYDEINAFNCQFEGYNGENTGSQVSALCSQLIANSKTYEDEIDKIPSVRYKNFESETEKIKYNGQDLDTITSYAEKLKEIKDSLDYNHTYTVSFTYSEEGCINEIIIEY